MRSASASSGRFVESVWTGSFPCRKLTYARRLLVGCAIIIPDAHICPWVQAYRAHPQWSASQNRVCDIAAANLIAWTPNPSLAAYTTNIRSYLLPRDAILRRTG